MCLLLYIFDCIQKSLLFFLARALVGTVLKGIIFQWLSLGSLVLSQFAIKSVINRVGAEEYVHCTQSAEEGFNPQHFYHRGDPDFQV